MEQILHDERRWHIREHLGAALFLAQASKSPLLRYLIEMALAENEGPSETALQSPQPSEATKASPTLSVLVNADLDPGELKAQKNSEDSLRIAVRSPQDVFRCRP